MSFKVNIYIATTWTSPRQKGGKAMWLVEFIKKDNTPATRQGIVVTEGKEMEAILTALKEAVSILTKSCTIRGFMRRNGVLNAYQNSWIKKWQKNDFRSSKGVGVAHEEKWRELIAELDKHQYEFIEGLGEYELYMRNELAKSVDFPLKEGE
ncbi:MAG: hypothetical protein IJF03_09950 [Lachnospiraceae bacterium]|nr:hypothetical protein [Lachnospiraceae bacterium]